ncbi:3-hydroxyacyl-ACP dehydratase FabZ [soil metagenome]
MTLVIDPEREQLDLADIKRSIPHRYPFLMIDRVANVVPGASAVGVKNVTSNEQHFEGHFPARAVMPGVLIIEAMAQTAAVLVVRTLGLVDHDLLVYFMSIDRARFRQPVMPGDQLERHVTVARGRGKILRFTAEARVREVLCAEADYMAMIMTPEDVEAKG